MGSVKMMCQNDCGPNHQHVVLVQLPAEDHEVMDALVGDHLEAEAVERELTRFLEETAGDEDYLIFKVHQVSLAEMLSGIVESKKQIAKGGLIN